MALISRGTLSSVSYLTGSAREKDESRRRGKGCRMRSLRRDGAALFYEEAQGDETPVLLVHGIGCDHTYFAPQFEDFARRGHRVVAVDLRGHGKSDKPEQSYTMQLFADDQAWL